MTAPNPQPTETPQEVLTILEAVAKVYSVSPADILGGRRTQHLVEPRHVLFYLCRRLLAWGWVPLGDALGFDHTSVLHGVRRVAGLCQTDMQTRTKIVVLLLALQAIDFNACPHCCGTGRIEAVELGKMEGRG